MLKIYTLSIRHVFIVIKINHMGRNLDEDFIFNVLSKNKRKRFKLTVPSPTSILKPLYVSQREERLSNRKGR
jgi:hypothetical protein